MFGKCLLGLGLVLATVFGVSPLSGQTTVTWDGNIVIGDWNNSARWNPNVVPNNGQPSSGDTYDVVIPTSSNVNLNIDATIRNFTHSGAAASINVNTLRNLSGANRTLTVNGLFDWTGGDFYGATVIDANGGISISGNDLKRMRVENVGNTGAIPVINNNGAAVWSDGGVNSTVLSIGQNTFFAQFNNNAGSTFDARSDAFWNVEFNNYGTFNRTTGSGIVRFQNPFNNHGIVNVNSGSLELNSGGTSTGTYDVAAGRTLYFFRQHDLQGASIVTGAGTARFSTPSNQGIGVLGPVSVNGTWDIANTIIDGGVNFNSAATTGTLLINNFNSAMPTAGTGSITVSGLTTYQFGNFAGDVTLNADGGVNFALTTNPRWSGNSVLNLSGGTSTWPGPFAILEFRENAQLNVLESAEFLVDNTVTTGTRTIKTFTTGGSFSNAGTLRKTNNGTLSIEIAATNAGLIHAQGGLINFVGALIQNNALAEIRLEGGNVGGDITLLDGSLTGSGTLLGPVDSSAFISPGLSAGALAFNSDLTLLDFSVLDMDIGGLNLANYDRILVNGTLTLDGVLNVYLIDSFNPALGDSFQLLTWSDVDGVFEQINLPPLDAGLAWNDANLYTTGTLSVVTAIPEPAISLLLCGVLTASIFHRRRRS